LSFSCRREKNANWSFPKIDRVITGPTADQKLKYEVWHMNALVFGRRPDGEPIMNSMLPGATQIGECSHSQFNNAELSCSISGIDFSDDNTEHFGHFHIKVKGGMQK